MAQAARISDLTVAVLAGGLGTRLGSVVADRPKVLAEIRGVPFLTYLLDQLAAAGCRSIVLCTGYMGELISHAFGGSYGSLRLDYSQEPEPLGTGGALRSAMTRFDSDPVLVMNGDSYCGIDFRAYWEWHCLRQATASMALAQVANSDRYGLVRFDSAARVVEFAEKKGGGDAWVNAGIYFLSQQVLRSIPEDKCVSLEREIFPRWVGRGLFGYPSPGPFLDIGTPGDFAAAESFFGRLKVSAPRRYVVLDRDGTIIEERDYLSRPDQVVLIPGVGAALRELRRLGFGLVVITNQSGLARGFFDQEQLQRIHMRLEHLLDEEGVRLDGFYVCPHKPDDDCACRKPKLGLLRKAASELGFNMQDSIVVGDKPCDIDMGRFAGAMTFLVRTGYGCQFENEAAADFVVDDIAAAADSIARFLDNGGTVNHGD